MRRVSDLGEIVGEGAFFDCLVSTSSTELPGLLADLQYYTDDTLRPENSVSETYGSDADSVSDSDLKRLRNPRTYTGVEAVDVPSDEPLGHEEIGFSPIARLRFHIDGKNGLEQALELSRLLQRHKQHMAFVDQAGEAAYIWRWEKEYDKPEPNPHGYT